MKQFKSVPVTLITGYLGSGKTTLLNGLLNNKQGRKIAVIVNDIGEVNIDAELIEKGGVVNSQDENLVSLQNGCICCTLKEDLIEQICSLIEKQKFDHIVIEASGICEPVPIAQTIVAIGEMCHANNMPKICHLDAIVSVVDAKRLADEFACGEVLSSQNDDDLANLVFQQLEFCNVVVLNKTDLVDNVELSKVKAVIKRIQPVAKIIETNFAKVSIEQVLDTNLFDFEKVAASAGWIQEMEKEYSENLLVDEPHTHHNHEHHHKHHHEHNGDHECECEGECHCHDHDHECECEGECHCHDHDHECECEHHSEQKHKHHHEHGCNCGHCHHDGDNEEYGIGTYVYARKEPMDQQKFAEFCSKDWGRKIIRAKGLLYFKNDLDMCYLFESAGNQKNLMQNGKWWASMPAEQLSQLRAEQPQLFAKWDEKYGDREVKLVFIGQNINKKQLKNTLDNI